MAIFELGKEALVPLIPTALEAENVLERRDLQRLLRVNIEAIAPNTMVLAEEFGEWADSKRRIDLLAVDRQANLVVVELKRSDDAAMELQAIRYAAMVAPMTFEQAVDIHRTFRERVGLQGDPEEAIMQFLDWAEPKEFGTDQKIVLAAADFSKELTTAVIWLNQRGLDIRCVRMKPYKLDSRVLLDIQQVVPLPEAAEYQISLRDKERSQAAEASRFNERRAFWERLLSRCKSLDFHLFESVSPVSENWISVTTGLPGTSWSYVIRQHDTQVELWMSLASAELTKELFDRIYSRRAEVEASFGAELDWQRLNERAGSRIRYVLTNGGYRDPDNWESIHSELITTMQRFVGALTPLRGA
ncbi:MAG: DUF4268 domain-containing protein [Dehalococcoidia bacterium]|jgi:hypothetical protein